MPTDTTANNLIINKLTKSQYDGIQNKSETELYLVSDEVDTIVTNQSNNLITSGAVYSALQPKADLASPALTGTPTAPTATTGTNTTQVATTAFVKATLDATLPSYLKYVYLEDESEFPQNPDSTTLYLIKESNA